MNDQRTGRLLALTGPLYTVLFVVVVTALEGSAPGEKASVKEVLDHYQGHVGRSTADALLGPLAAALVVLFFSHLRTLVRERRVAPGPGPTVMICGAVLWAGGLLMGSTTTLAVSSAADHGQGQVAQTFNVLNNDSWIPFIAGIAITLLGAGLTLLSTHVLPRWMAWTALVVGIVSLMGPGGFLGFFVAPLWMLVAGVLLARAGTRELQERRTPFVERRATQPT
jgi:hypothetical protein